MPRLFKAAAAFLLLSCFYPGVLLAFPAPVDTIVSAKPVWYIGAKFYGGFTFSPYERVRNVEAHTLDGEISVSRATFGTKAWQQIHGYPRIGLALDYLDLGRPTLTGHVIALIPNIQWNLVHNNSSALFFRLGFGTGYFDKIFNVQTNYKDKAISTPFNVCIQLNATATHKISDHFEINGGLSFTHFSNGSLRVPNNGINIPALVIGADYIITQPKAYSPLSPEAMAVKKVAYFYAYSALSFETKGYNREKHYTIYSISAVYGKRISRKSKMGIGLDVYYDRTIPSDSMGQTRAPKNFNEPIEAGIKIEHEVVMGNLGIVTNAGRYIYHINKINGPWYQVIGVKYNFCPNVFAGMFLKTHFASADFIQFAVGVNF
jgi:hypothetical protein